MPGAAARRSDSADAARWSGLFSWAPEALVAITVLLRCKAGVHALQSGGGGGHGARPPVLLLLLLPSSCHGHRARAARKLISVLTAMLWSKVCGHHRRDATAGSWPGSAERRTLSQGGARASCTLPDPTAERQAGARFGRDSSSIPPPRDTGGKLGRRTERRRRHLVGSPPPQVKPYY